MTNEPSKLIKTPCVNVCVVETETGECIGCGRTRVEIAGWMKMSDSQRDTIIALLPERLSTLTKRKTRTGGARARRAKSQIKPPSPVIINFKGP